VEAIRHSNKRHCTLHTNSVDQLEKEALKELLQVTSEHRQTHLNRLMSASTKPAWARRGGGEEGGGF
jgi:hypothetical protein